jgi:hypothetical protein
VGVDETEEDRDRQHNREGDEDECGADVHRPEVKAIH